MGSRTFQAVRPRSEQPRNCTQAGTLILPIWENMPPRKRPTSDSSLRPAIRQNPAQHLASFLRYQEVEVGMARNSLLAYGSDLRQFFEWLETHGPQTLNAIDLKLLSGYLAHLHERGLSSTTVARHLVAIKMFFRYLLLEGVIRESVVDLVSSPKLWQHLPHVLSPDMVNRLLAAPQGADRFMLRDRALLALLYATGCRASEVVNLKLRDVHLDQSYCRCVGKGNKERLVSLNPIACRALEAYLTHERPLLAGQSACEEALVSKSRPPPTRIIVGVVLKNCAQP